MAIGTLVQSIRQYRFQEMNNGQQHVTNQGFASRQNDDVIKMASITCHLYVLFIVVYVQSV